MARRDDGATGAEPRDTLLPWAARNRAAEPLADVCLVTGTAVRDLRKGDKGVAPHAGERAIVFVESAGPGLPARVLPRSARQSRAVQRLVGECARGVFAVLGRS